MSIAYEYERQYNSFERNPNEEKNFKTRTVGQEQYCENHPEFKNFTYRPTRQGEESCISTKKMAMEEWNCKEREKLLLKKKSGKLRKKFGIWGSDRGTSLKPKSGLDESEVGGGQGALLYTPPSLPLF